MIAIFGLGDIWTAWKIMFLLIIFNSVKGHLGESKIAAIVALVIGYYVLFVYSVQSTLIYLLIQFIMAWQGLFFIQMMMGKVEQEKSMKHSMPSEEDAAEAMQAQQAQQLQRMMGGAQ